ncbi:myc-associated zinc finger protein-like [Perca flavescens]|uniref:myc-associated zinc finger protein-like n=1 Tax=Perca flavescens TaxID=8167 RepID=UPI00106EF79E|nr:myc-associated zinc finger protein-like [Perca flavescens]
MDTSWSNFLFQTPSTPSQAETPLQSDLLPELSGSAPSPPADHMASPPSTVDTAALSEEPPPVRAVARPSRPAHVCSTCNKEFKNSYNLRRHQSVHTGVRMKDRAAREKEDSGRGGGGEGASVPPPAHAAPAASASLAAPQRHRPPARQPGEPGGVCVHRPGDRNHGCAASAHPGSCCCCGLHGAGGSWTPETPPHVFTEAKKEPPTPTPTQVRKNHACEACGKAFRDVYHLNRHRLSHSDEKPYSCPVCQQRFKRKDRMSYHVRSHQGAVEKPYVCPHCAKAFSRPDHLNSHVRQVHSTERPFKCTTCTSAFATRDRLRAHLVRHEEKVPCHICGKLLSAAYITDHMRVHNQSQHHACHLCNRSFTTLTYLRVHAQKHHGQEWKESGGARGGFGGTGAGGVLLCQLCGVQCKTVTQLQGHMGTHGGQGDPGVGPGDPGGDQTSVAGPVGTTSVAVTVSSASTVGLLVTDCSGIAPQAHS